MKLMLSHIIFYFIIAVFITIFPPGESVAQKDSITVFPVIQNPPLNPINQNEIKEQWRTILPIQKIILQSQQEQIAANQDTILMLRNKRRIVKVKYIKIYKTFPLYVPVVDSSIYLTMRDTLNDYFLDTIATRKPGLFKRIFHHKQN